MIDTILIHEMRDPHEGCNAENDEEVKDQICSKCLELLEECQCDFYDKIEEIN